MADLLITRAKSVTEVIKLYADFSVDLLPEETISSCNPTVSVFSGDDNDPSNLLYQVPEITGAAVSQRIKEGIPGVTYNILLSIVTSDERAVEKVTRLSILPNNTGATPRFIPLYLTSKPYPYILTEELSPVSIDSIAGKFLLLPTPQDAMAGSAALVSMGVYGGEKNYTDGPDTMQGSTALLAMSVYGGVQNYSIPGDIMKGSSALLAMSVYGGVVNYPIPGDTMAGSAALLDMKVYT